jgi:hypothetical protein
MGSVVTETVIASSTEERKNHGADIVRIVTRYSRTGLDLVAFDLEGDRHEPVASHQGPERARADQSPTIDRAAQTVVELQQGSG